MRAVIDRIIDDNAIVLLGEKEIQIDISLSFLPQKAKEGSVLKVTFELDEEGETQQREKIANLLNKLKNKNLSTTK